jgi:2-polyprenyl-3-methyl-5-hydroxy-6-metoxy-1,4-benzoquinol methylase
LCAGRTGRPVWHEDGQSYVRCAACHIVFTDIEERAYEDGRHNAWDEEAPDTDSLMFYGDARIAAHTAFLDRFPPRGGARLLDVGCGLGFFLERAQGRGWDVHGCEPSHSWAALAERRVGAGRVTRGGVEKVPEEHGGFDLIAAWDVVEHVFDPVPFLAALRDRLNPGGRLFLRTPNLDWVLPTYRIRRWLGHGVELGPLNHVVYFTARTMSRALASAGLRPEGWLVLPPPQVATFEADPEKRYAPSRSGSVRLKNAWAGAAGLALGASGGRIALASDLDVLARASGAP